jgi:hypothetical protein
VAIGDRFRVKVGAKCTASCRLGGNVVELVDETGAVVASGRLGPMPAPGTTALYWTTLEATVPTEVGTFNWTARFSPSCGPLPHSGASASFRFMTVPRPEHSVVVRITTRGTGSPVTDAVVRIGAFRSTTDKAGLVRLAVPAGTYRLAVWKANHKFPERTVEVAADLDLDLEAEILPKKDPFAYWNG